MDNFQLEAEDYDAWANPDDDEPYDTYLDTPLEQQEGGAAWIAEHNRAVAEAVASTGSDARLIYPHRSIEDIPDGLSPRAAGDRARHPGHSLRQRTRLKVGAFGTDDALRVHLAEQTEWDWPELIQPTPRGRLTADEQRRRDELARIVAIARADGAAFETIARLLSRSLATVHALASASSV